MRPQQNRQTVASLSALYTIHSQLAILLPDHYVSRSDVEAGVR